MPWLGASLWKQAWEPRFGGPCGLGQGPVTRTSAGYGCWPILAVQPTDQCAFVEDGVPLLFSKLPGHREACHRCGCIRADILKAPYPPVTRMLPPLPAAPDVALAVGVFSDPPPKGQLCVLPQAGLPMRLEQFITDYGFEN